VVPFQSLSTSTPATALGSVDQPELLRQGGGVSGRSRPDPAGAKQVRTDLQMATKTGELGVLTVPTNLFHGTLPECYPEASSCDACDGGSHSLSGVRLGSIRGRPEHDLNYPTSLSYGKTNTKSKLIKTLAFFS
jgi:hypothetical protein